MTDLTADEPHPEQLTALERLARAARSLEPGSLPEALWKAAFELPLWWVPAQHTPEGISTTVGPLEGVTAMFAFTTRGRAQTFIDDQDLEKGDEPAFATPVAPAWVVEMSPVFRHVGTDILLFDCNDTGFFAPMGSLTNLWHQIFGAPPVTSHGPVAPPTSRMSPQDPD